MPLLKSPTLPPAGAAFAFVDIERQAQNALELAMRKAEALLAEAQQEADAMRATAAAEGHAEGLARGLKEGHEKGFAAGKAEGAMQANAAQTDRLHGAIELLSTAGDAVANHAALLGGSAADELLSLAIAISRRVVRTIAARDRAVVEATIREAVRLAASKASIRIAVNPDQRADLAHLIDELKLVWPSIEQVQFVDDLSLAPGGCRVLTAAGEIDADIVRQLDKLEAELRPAAAE